MRKINLLTKATESMVELWYTKFNIDDVDAMHFIYSQLNERGKDILLQYASEHNRYYNLKEYTYRDFDYAFDMLLNDSYENIWKILTLKNQIKAITMRDKTAQKFI